MVTWQSRHCDLKDLLASENELASLSLVDGCSVNLSFGHDVVQSFVLAW